MAWSFSQKVVQHLTGPEQWLKNVDRGAVRHAPYQQRFWDHAVKSARWQQPAVGHSEVCFDMN